MLGPGWRKVVGVPVWRHEPTTLEGLYAGGHRVKHNSKGGQCAGVPRGLVQIGSAWESPTGF